MSLGKLTATCSFNIYPVGEEEVLPAVKEEMGVKTPCPSFFLPVVGWWWPEDRSSPTFVRGVLWSRGPPPSSLLPAALEAF